jgi:ADP-heptose:LPS heptosyltransferase
LGGHSFGIILSRPDRVGDVIIATACLPPLRQQRPGERIVFVAREVMRPLLEDHPLLDRFIPIPSDANVLTSVFREQETTAFVHLHPDRICQWAGWRAGIPERIGYRSSLLLDWTLTVRQDDRRHEGRWHEAQYNFDLLATIGIRPPPIAELRPAVHLADRCRDSLETKLAAVGGSDMGKYIALNPTAFSPTHRWPAENFAWLAQALHSSCERIVLVGERADDPSVATLRALLSNLSGNVVDLGGRLNLGELGWLLRDAALLVSRNTGTTHLAAAVGCPTVELFGRLEPAYGPARWRALGDRIRGVNAPPLVRGRFESKQAFWQRSFASISRAEVLAASLDLLDHG